MRQRFFPCLSFYWWSGRMYFLAYSFTETLFKLSGDFSAHHRGSFGAKKKNVRNKYSVGTCSSDQRKKNSYKSSKCDWNEEYTKVHLCFVTSRSKPGQKAE